VASPQHRLSETTGQAWKEIDGSGEMAVLQSVSVQRLYRLIADQIAEKIRSGEFAVGARLPAERDLAEQLNVARSTVREALIALEIGGHVEVRVGSGVFVLPPRGEPALATAANPNGGKWAAALEASPFELLETRLLFEPECAALAAQNGSPEQFAAIQQLHDLMAPERSTQATDLACHRAFHEAIAAAGANAALASVVSHVWDLIEASPLFRRLDMHFVTNSVWRLAVDEHERVLNFILARDPHRARQAMSYHLLSIIARLSEDIS
jgi:DNA-binding FadR family transcriptional regulator